LMVDQTNDRCVRTDYRDEKAASQNDYAAGIFVTFIITRTKDRSMVLSRQWISATYAPHLILESRELGRSW
jgi:hypothetical protein